MGGEAEMKIPDDIDIISQLELGDFVKLESPEIGFETELALKVDGRMVGKSQLRQDFEGNLYVADWLYGKEWE